MFILFQYHIDLTIKRLLKTLSISIPHRFSDFIQVNYFYVFFYYSSDEIILLNILLILL